TIKVCDPSKRRLRCPASGLLAGGVHYDFELRPHMDLVKRESLRGRFRCTNWQPGDQNRETEHSWFSDAFSLRSIAKMPRVLQHALKACALCVALAALTPWEPSSSSLAADLQPSIEPAKHKGYIETIPGSKTSFEMVAIPG